MILGRPAPINIPYTILVEAVDKVIVSNPKVSRKFYAVNNRGLFISTYSGDSWKKLDTPWPGEYLPQIPWALAINDK